MSNAPFNVTTASDVRTLTPTTGERLHGQSPNIGQRYNTWFKNKDGSDCKLLRIDPYSGIYRQHYNCVLVFESDNCRNPVEMTYQITRNASGITPLTQDITLMNTLQSQVAALEQQAAQKAAAMDDAVERIVGLTSAVDAFEKGELSAVGLARAVKHVITFYTPLSKAFLAELAAKGYQKGALQKYVDSTYQGALIQTVKVTQEGGVFATTVRGEYHLGMLPDGYDFTQSLDYILCGMDHVEGLILNK